MGISRSKANDRILRMAVIAYVKDHPTARYAEVARAVGCSPSFASRIGLELGHAKRPAGRPPAKDPAAPRPQETA